MSSVKCSSPGCAKPVDDDHRYFDFHSISCEVCHTFRHWSCHGLSKSDYLLVREMTNYPFICPSCRKRCEINYGIKKLFEEIINAKIGITGNGNKDFGIKEAKVKVEFSLIQEPVQRNSSEARKSCYDPVPSPIAVDTEPVYEMPKFLRNESENNGNNGNEKEMNDYTAKCYYV